jgi:hypothetical protein
MISGVQPLQEAGIIVVIIRDVRPSNVEETNLSCLRRLLRGLGEALQLWMGFVIRLLQVDASHTPEHSRVQEAGGRVRCGSR